MSEEWLTWAKELQSIAQAGLEYSKDRYDRQRFIQIRELSVEIMSAHTGMTTDKLYDLFANESGYQTPKVDVRGVVPKDDKILLVRENDGKWALPGGWAEPGLSVAENITKEVREESGFEVKPLRVVAVLDRAKHADDNYPYSVYKIFVACSMIGGNFRENIETTAAGFFSEGKLPELSSNRTTREQIRMCFAHIRNENTGVVFD